MSVLKRDFYLRNTSQVARDLLGKRLFVKEAGRTLSGIIVETEAYLGLRDPACHSYHGKKTERVATMYLEGGHSYVYFIYGMYFCFNVVTGNQTEPEAVLIRAIEPDEASLDFLQENRGARVKQKDLTNGPGKLCLAFAIRKHHNGLDLTRKPSRRTAFGIWIEETGIQISPRQIVTTTRIGIESRGEAAHWPERYYIKNNSYVSKK